MLIVCCSYATGMIAPYCWNADAPCSRWYDVGNLNVMLLLLLCFWLRKLCLLGLLVHVYDLCASETHDSLTTPNQNAFLYCFQYSCFSNNLNVLHYFQYQKAAAMLLAGSIETIQLISCLDLHFFLTLFELVSCLLGSSTLYWKTTRENLHGCFFFLFLRSLICTNLQRTTAEVLSFFVWKKTTSTTPTVVLMVWFWYDFGKLMLWWWYAAPRQLV